MNANHRFDTASAIPALRDLFAKAADGSPEKEAWAKAIFAEAFRDHSKPEAFGPPDLRHPMKKLFTRLINSGQPVMLIDGDVAVSFNKGEMK